MKWGIFAFHPLSHSLFSKQFSFPETEIADIYY